MAELDTRVPTHTGSRLTWGQFAAVGWLRWRIFANSFRRKGGGGEFVGRLLLAPLLLALTLGPAAGAGFVSWLLASHDDLQRLDLVLWGAFGLTQLLNINLGQPGTSFDPTELIRFPIALRNYVLVRLCFGLLSPANIVVTLISVAMVIGITVARPHLWFWAFAAMAAFALANVLFSRMIFAWVDRWLSTRRAREVFSGLIFAASLGFQYVNVTFNPGFHNGRSRTITPENLHRAQWVLHYAHPWLRWLPPELTRSALVAAQFGRASIASGHTALVLVYAGLFVFVYGWRMRTEYRGENLSDLANAVRDTARRPRTTQARPDEAIAAPLEGAVAARRSRFLPPTLGPLLEKELLVLRRNTGLLYGVIAPTVMVFLFAGRLSLRGGSHWLLLMAVGYALLGIAPMSYNSFGMDGAGAQFYFMAPVSLRDVFFAKNTMQFLLALFEVCVVVGIVAYVAGRPHLSDVLFVFLWALTTLLLNTNLGNLRSISAPKKVNPGRSINRTQSQVSAWIAIGILVGCAGLGAALQFLGSYFEIRWLSVALMAALAAGACVAYEAGLRGIEVYAMERRESLFEELGKHT